MRPVFKQNPALRQRALADSQVLYHRRMPEMNNFYELPGGQM